ncbi:MAG: hypothetical protein SNJ78_00640 [Spirochaetales bacterium]
MELQQHLFTLSHHPSCFALPPLLPLSLFSTLEQAREAFLEENRVKTWEPFRLSAIISSNSFLVAGPTPLSSQEFVPAYTSSNSAPGELSSGLLSLPRIEGFYLCQAELDKESLQNIPFSPFSVRVLRLQLMQIACKHLEHRFWEQIEWQVEIEKWIKLV